VGDFKTSLSLIVRSSRQKKNQQGNFRIKRNYKSNGLNRKFRAFYSTATEYTFFSAAHRNFTKINHILGYKASLSKHKNIEIISCSLPDHNGIKLEINNKRNCRKYPDTWR
jgi:hypothetical protein